MSPAALAPASLLKLLSINQSAAAVGGGLSPAMIRKLIRLGQLPCVRIGRRVLVAETDLAAFVASRRTGGQAVDELAAARGAGR